MRVLGRAYCRTSTWNPRQRGQALVEFALVLVPMMVIFLGILQFGVLFSSQLGLINGTREGARYGATLASATGSSTDIATVYCYTLGMKSDGTPCLIGGTTQTGTLGRGMPAYSKTNVCRESTAPCTSDVSSVAYCYFPNPDLTYSLRLDVHVVYRHPLFIPLISAIVDAVDGQSDNALRAGTTESFRVEGPTFTSATLPSGVPLCTN